MSGVPIKARDASTSTAREVACDEAGRVQVILAGYAGDANPLCASGTAGIVNPFGETDGCVLTSYGHMPGGVWSTALLVTPNFIDFNAPEVRCSGGGTWDTGSGTFTWGTPLVQFNATVAAPYITQDAPAPGATAAILVIRAQAGGAAYNAAGKPGATVRVMGGIGGAGDDTYAAGNGGPAGLYGAIAGAPGNAGGANGGGAYMSGGAGTGSGTHGTINIGTLGSSPYRTSAINLGNATDNPPISLLGSGALSIGTPTIQVAKATASPTISHQTDDATGGVRPALTVKAQSSTVGGSTGGDLVLQPGHGVTEHGKVIIYDADGVTARAVFGGHGAGLGAMDTDVCLNGGSYVYLYVGGSIVAWAQAGSFNYNVASLGFLDTVSSPTISHFTDAAAGGVRSALTIHAQDTTVGGGTGGNLVLRPGHGATHGGLTLQDADATNRFVVGTTGEVSVYGATSFEVCCAGTSAVVISEANGLVVQAHRPIIQFASDCAAPSIYQANRTSGNGQNLTVHAQDVITATSVTGGFLVLRGGDANTTASLGGDVQIRPGHGNSANGALSLYDADGSTIRIGWSGAGTQINYNAGSTHAFQTGGTLRASVSASGIAVYGPSVYFAAAQSSPKICQEDCTGASGQTLTVQAQNATNATGTIIGGHLNLVGGNAAGAGSLRVGGSVCLSGGTGTDYGGIVGLHMTGSSAAGCRLTKDSYQVAIGDQCGLRGYGEIAMATRSLHANGDCQVSFFQMSGTTSGTTPADLFLDGAAKTFGVDSYRMLTLVMWVQGYSPGQAKNSAFRVEAVFYRDGSTLVRDKYTSTAISNAVGSAVLNTATNAIKLTVTAQTGVTGTSYWNAFVIATVTGDAVH